MLRLQIVIFILFLACGCSINQEQKNCEAPPGITSPDSELIGVWKSNLDLTMASLNQVEGLPKEVSELFYNDFFGHLVAEFKLNEARFYFENEDDNYEEELEFSPYILREENEFVFVVEAYDELIQDTKVTVMGREGNCYFVPIQNWGFNEYFCKISTDL